MLSIYQNLRHGCLLLLWLSIPVTVCVGLIAYLYHDTATDIFPVRSGDRTNEERTEIPASLRGLIGSLQDLNGRHSDYINDSNCSDPEKQYQWNTSKEYDFIGPFKYLPNFKNPCFHGHDGKLKCLPYFYIIGAPKAGSSDLYIKISKHPQVRVGVGKEIRWFDRRRFGEALPHPKFKTFNGFLDFFAQATASVNANFTEVSGVKYHNTVIGDGGPTSYFSSYYRKRVPGNEGCSEPRVTTISHIHHLWPRAKLLLIVRNPVTRLFSSYMFNANVTGANRTAEQFHDWTQQSLDVWGNCLRQHSFRYCMYEGTVEWKSKLWELHIGQYSRYIVDVLKIFPRKQLMVIHLEDYSVRTKKWIRDIFEFLELEPVTDKQLEVISKLKAENANTDGRKNSMLQITQRTLTDFYAPFNLELSDILNDKMFLWEAN